MTASLIQLRQALKEAFSEPPGWLFAGAGTLFVLFLAMLLPSLGLLRFIFGEPIFDGGFKAVTAVQVLWGARLSLLHDGRWPLFLLALLFGLDAALIAHYMRRQVRLNRSAGAGAAGMLVGLVGIGCASCGSVFLTSLLGLGTTVGIIRDLPLHGEEFTWIGILAIAASVLSVAGKIAAPEACAIPQKR